MLSGEFHTGHAPVNTYELSRFGWSWRVTGGGQLGNAPGEGLPPGCSCVLVAPGALYEARVLTPTCRVHGAHELVPNIRVLGEGATIINADRPSAVCRK